MKVVERLTAVESSLDLHHGSALRHETTLSNSNTLTPFRAHSVMCRALQHSLGTA